MTSASNSASPSVQLPKQSPDDALATTSRRPNPQHYVAPVGFDRNRWGDSIRDVAQLDYLRLAFYRHTTDAETVQFYTDRCPGSPQHSKYACFADSLPHPGKLDPGSTHHLLLAEYQRPSVSFYAVDTGALFDQIAYQFCASYLGDAAAKSALARPGSFLADVSLCGIRLKFNSIPDSPNHVSTGASDGSGSDQDAPNDPRVLDNGVRVLDALKQAYGPPAPQPAHPHRGFDRIEHYTWCDDVLGDVLMKCPSEVMYTFDKRTHKGIVSFVTPIVFAYLYERRARLERGMQAELVDLYFLLLPRNPPVRLSHAPKIIAEEFEPQDLLDSLQHRLYDINPSLQEVERTKVKSGQQTADPDAKPAPQFELPR